MPSNKQKTLEQDSDTTVRSISAKSENLPNDTNDTPASANIEVPSHTLKVKTASSFDIFLDFCLTCDKECEGIYCSQACRLADLGAQTIHSTAPPAFDPTYLGNIAKPGSMLKPAFGFNERDKCWKPYPTALWAGQPSSTRSPSLLTSSSASHSSIIGAGPGKQARADLLGYFRTFDELRAANRRSLGSN
jgi:hypothetical protein